jgi:hypothetical protein
MKKQFKKGVQLFSAVVFTACTFGSLELKAQAGGQMFQLANTFKIGGHVNAVSFIKSTSTPLVAIGTQNYSGTQAESSGNLEIRNVLTGAVVSRINTYNKAVYALSASTVYPYVAVGTIHGASVNSIYGNKRTTLQTPSRGVITAILFNDATTVSNTEIVTADQDGYICFFKFDSTVSYLLPHKTIKYPVNPQNPSMQNINPAVVSITTFNNILTAGYVNQVVAWDTTNWAQKFQINEPTGSDGNARIMDVIDAASGNANFVLAADGDSIQGYNYDGSQRFKVPFVVGDYPSEIIYGYYNFPFAAISTGYDKCLVYSLDNNTASLIGNFSNHTYTVSSVDFWSFGTGRIFMATGSGDQTVEIWRYNEQYTR